MKNNKVNILSIGDELLIGQVINTNAAWIASQLTISGFEIHEIRTVHDDYISINEGLSELSKTADIIITTGGLGPTNDDVSKRAIAGYLDLELKKNKEQWEHIKNYFESSGRSTTHFHETQAFLPEGARLFHNSIGTAFGIGLQKNNKTFLLLPGVPYEMKHIFSEGKAQEWIEENSSVKDFLFKTFMTVGVAETTLATKLEEFEDSLPENMTLSYLPSLATVRLRLTLRSPGNKEEGENILKTFAERLENTLGNIIYGEDEISIEEHIGNLLRSKGHTVATAESCTGGNIAHRITSIPGSSDYFKGSVVAYANSVKKEILQVRKNSLEKHGAVSETVVKEMVSGVCRTLNTTYGIASSGIAGPGGGTESKPVGTIWIAAGNEKNIKTEKLQLGNNRMKNIKLSTTLALNLLRKFLLA